MAMDWQNKYKNVQDRNRHLLETGKFADCKFLVGIEDDKNTISAHKIILATASPVFEKMFFGELAEQSYPIVIPDVEPDKFKDLLEYIYTNRIKITSIEYAIELYCLGDKYMMSNVMDECMEYINYKLDAKNACRTYDFARFFNLVKLKTKCMNVSINLIFYMNILKNCLILPYYFQIIVARTKYVLAEPNFEDIEFATLLDILESNQLFINDEIELYYALERYAEKRVLNNNNSIKLESSSAKESTEKCTFKDNRNTFITEEEFRMALKKIRFLTMFPKDFARGPACSKFLKSDEINKFFMLILCPDDMDFAIPEGFTESRVNRCTG